jgi:hypothetical protein
MNTDQHTHWIAWSAFVLASAALGVAIGAGCRRSIEARPERASATAGHDSAPALLASARFGRIAEEAEPKGPATRVSAEQVPVVDTGKSAPPGGGLKVRRLSLTNRIADREPAEYEGAFLPDGSSVFAFVELQNVSESPEEIVLTFEQSGRPAVGHVKLPVPGKAQRFRTWGQSRRVRSAGQWQAVVRTAQGQELAREGFEVSSPVAALPQ